MHAKKPKILPLPFSFFQNGAMPNRKWAHTTLGDNIQNEVLVVVILVVVEVVAVEETALRGGSDIIDPPISLS
jgi:hypothetical protein